MHYLTNWLNQTGKKIIFLLILIVSLDSRAQQADHFSLEQAIQLARQNYPLIKQKDLVKQVTQINLQNLDKNFLPQFSLSGQATYQSDVTRIDIPIAGIKIDPPSRDQYKILADVNQLVYDGGYIKQQKQSQQLNGEVEDQKVEVELFKVKERINQLFLGVLYIDEQKKQAQLIRLDLQTGIKNVDAQVQNGVAFKSNLNLLKAELLKTDQRLIELQSGRKGLIDILALFIGKTLDENIVLERPRATAIPVPDINRPEIKLFTDQSKFLDQQKNLIKAKNLPRTSLFVQGGYAKPALNFLKNGFELFYIGGVRLNWSLGGYYTSKKEKQLVDINSKIIDLQKETFLLNTNTQLKQQQSEIDKLNLLLVSDEEIINLRKSVKDAARAQLENGVITANDYLREVTAEDQARQTLITHQLQLLQAQINYQTIIGK